MAKSPTLLSEVPFGSFLVYSPRGTSEESKNSRVVCDAVKFDRPGGILQVVAKLVEDFESTELAQVLGPDVSLVPAPRSTPLVKGALWPAHRVAEELVKVRLGKEILPLVQRTTPVKKSAFAAAGQRPTPQEHLESLALDPQLVAATRLTIVDDVLTKGATTLAVASILKAHFPNVDVRIFAMIRTMGLQPDISAIRAAVVGKISLNSWGEAKREP